MARLLDHSALSLFDHALAEGRLDLAAGPRAYRLSAEEFDRACRVLVDLRLLHPDPFRPETLVPMNPETAASTVVAPMEEEIARTKARMRSIRGEFAALMPHYRAARQASEHRHTVEVLPGTVGAAPLLAQESSHCRHEVFAIRKEALLTGVPEDALRRELALLGRGVRVRTLCRLGVDGGSRFRDQLAVLGSAGAQFRAAPELPHDATVFDRSVAVLTRIGPDGTPAGTLVIRDAESVAYLCHVFDQLWAAAAPFRPGGPAPVGGAESRRADSEVRRAVVGMLAQGTKDEMIARRLGVSLRTCRRHIAEILESLQAQSRFQAGVLAERAGLTRPASAPAHAPAPLNSRILQPATTPASEQRLSGTT
ncbi:DUF6879 family protein [Streptomyces sp. NBC_01190]|uniref:helix-turn-helix transcriptional regulator n=1 Tax=Streptomyces sp. NBC_01190 TaxID=2903767 RepID=UPI0038632FD5|nr:LuxR C-terminal-related transcriptional regulator [Streptomyces sp. NBC_01190]